jgi:hypothetical protein
MHRHECNTHNCLLDLENQTRFFSYTRFPVKKINVGKVLKLWENCYLIILSIHILKLEISGCDSLKPSGPTFSRDLYVHTIPPSVGLGPSWARQVRNRTCLQDSGVSVEERWRWDHPLRATPVWPHRSISQLQCNPFWGGDHFEGQMQDGTVTTESWHGRMGSASCTLTGCDSALGSGIHALQSCSIYSYSRVLRYGDVPW